MTSELSNAYFLAKFRFDTAENEPCKVCTIERCNPPPSLPLPTHRSNTGGAAAPRPDCAGGVLRRRPPARRSGGGAELEAYEAMFFLIFILIVG